METRPTRAVRAFFAILAAVFTILAVVAIKREAIELVSGWSLSAIIVADVVVIVPALAVVIWVYLLRPMLERRQQR